jgi:V8-like Glu-specific endopeptidase
MDRRPEHRVFFFQSLFRERWRDTAACALLPALLLVLACAPPEAPDIGSTSQEIVNGTVDTGHPAVGILHSGGASACTATLIEPDKVLTAAHCVLNPNPPYNYLQPIHFYVGGLYGTRYYGSSVAAHPNYAGANKSDIAVVWLSSPVQTAAPKPMATTAPAFGEQVTLVGYGLSGENVGQFGTKRVATNVIAGVQAQIFSIDGTSASYGNLCDGDSGGPTFAMRNGVETLIGVHSSKLGMCGQTGVDMRVDTFRSWVNSVSPSGSAYGNVCQTGADCLTGLCIPVDGDAYCTQECDTQACPNGDDCVAVTGASGISKACLPNTGTGGTGQLGDPCQINTDCSSSICVSVPDKGNFCSEQCDLATNNCPSGYICANSSIGGVCVEGTSPPPPPPPPSKELGEPCEKHSECISGMCGVSPQVCIELCDPAAEGACPEGFSCNPVGDKGVCLEEDPPQPPPPPPPPAPEKGELGAGCSESSECKSQLCATDGAGNQFCTEPCDPESGCVEGFTCTPVGDTHVCAPEAEPAAASEDSGGCMVSPGNSPSGGGLIAFALLMLLAITRQRAG